MREYLPLGSSDAETAALGEALLGGRRGPGGGGGGGGSPGGRRKGGSGGLAGSPQHSGAGDVERGGASETFIPATPASRWVSSAAGGAGLGGWMLIQAGVRLASVSSAANTAAPPSAFPCPLTSHRVPVLTEMSEMPSPGPRRLLP